MIKIIVYNKNNFHDKWNNKEPACRLFLTSYEFTALTQAYANVLTRGAK